MSDVVDGRDAPPSRAALDCLARWFAGPRNELRSHEPHDTLAEVRGAMDELVDRGLVVRTAFNAAGSLMFVPTAEGARLGAVERTRRMRDLLGTGEAAPAVPA